MTRRDLLHLHCQSCKECKRVEHGDSPVCTPRYILELMAEGE